MKRRTLTSQLVAAVLVLIALTALLMAGAARGSVSFLLQRELDASVRLELATALANPEAAVGLDRGPGSGALRAVVTETGGSGSYVEGRRTGDLTPAQIEELQTKLSEPQRGRDGLRTISLAQLGDYRIASAPTATGTLVVGESLARMTQVVTRLTVAILGIGCAVTLLAGGGGTWWLRRRLSPLRDVAAAARAVAPEDLLRPDAGITRAPDPGPRTGSEIADVSHALNELLDTVEESMSERDRIEAQLRQFIADASHELRTPLAAMSGWTQLLAKDASSRDEALTHMHLESERMTKLVTELLALARLDQCAGAETTDLTPIVAEAVARWSAPAHHLDVDLDPSAAIIATSEETATRLVTNLLTNAHVHTPPGTRITVSLARAGTDVVLTVTDNGPGVPADLAGRVFDRFVRGDASRARMHGGSTGLGLAIAKAAAADAGGELTLSPTPGGGATFTARLPIHS